MGKKAKLKQLKKNGETYNLLHYTKELYLEIFPEADIGDYYAYLLSNEEARIKEEEKKKNIYIATVRHVAIGDDYLNFLEEHNLENSYENRLAYAMQLTDEKVNSLWQKFKNEKETRFIPFVAVSQGEELADQSVISREQAEKAKAILAQTFQIKKEMISIHPKFLRYDETGDNLLGNTNVSLVKENEKETCMIRFLAVSVSDARQAIQTRKEFNQGRWSEQKLPHVSLTNWAEGVWSDLLEKAEIISVPGLLASTQTKDFSDAFQVNLQKINA